MEGIVWYQKVQAQINSFVKKIALLFEQSVNESRTKKFLYSLCSLKKYNCLHSTDFKREHLKIKKLTIKKILKLSKDYQSQHLKNKKNTTKKIRKFIDSFANEHRQVKSLTIKNINKFTKDYQRHHLFYKKKTIKFVNRQNKLIRKWKEKHRSQIYLGLVTIGILLISFGSLSIFYRRTILSFQVSPTVITRADLRSPLPTSIIFENLKIEIPIIEAKIEDGIWQTSDSHATHLDTSMRPGEKGNIVIYGHNKKKLFAPLGQISKGQKISVVNSQNEKYQYLVVEKFVVKPEQIEAVLPTNREELTVYTCTGWFDSQRLVIKALPLK